MTIATALAQEIKRSEYSDLTRTERKEQLSKAVILLESLSLRLASAERNEEFQRKKAVAAERDAEAGVESQLRRAELLERRNADLERQVTDQVAVVNAATALRYSKTDSRTMIFSMLCDAVDALNSPSPPASSTFQAVIEFYANSSKHAYEADGGFLARSTLATIAGNSPSPPASSTEGKME